MRNRFLALILVAVLAGASLPGQARPAYAISAAKASFGATCGDFSLIIAINGTTDDGNGFDRFRYLILDGAGKKLYAEEATRRLGVTVGSQVINFSYDNDGPDGPPSQNPIRLVVQDIDANGVVTATLTDETTNASCLPPASTITQPGNFRPIPYLRAKFLVNSLLYRAPGREPINGLQIEAGKEFFAYYRSPDGAWVAVDVSGESLVWVPVTAVSVEIGRLGVIQTRIDGSDPSNAPGQGIVGLPGTPTTPGSGGITAPVPGEVARALVTTALRLRAAPSLTATRITTIPRGTVIPVFGRSENGVFIKVQYREFVGWVSTGFIVLLEGTLPELPVIFE